MSNSLASISFLFVGISNERILAAAVCDLVRYVPIFEYLAKVVFVVETFSAKLFVLVSSIVC